MVKINSFISNFEMREIMRFAVKATLFLLPLLILMGSTNFLIDPANKYKSKNFERAIAEVIFSKGAVNVVDFNERLVQKFFIEKQILPPYIAIIGSSRSMPIRPDMFPGFNVVNNSVSSATLGDYLGILFNYDKKGILPKKIVLGVEPWTLNPNAAVFWECLKSDVFAMLNKIESDSSSFKTPLISQRLSNLFSLSYFQGSVRRLLKKDHQNNKYFPINADVADYMVLLKDSNLLHNKVSFSKTIQELRIEVKDKKLYGNGQAFEFKKPSIEWGNVLEKAILYLQEKQIEVVLFLPPYHPDIYNNFLRSSQNKVIVEIEDYFKKLAKRHSLKIIGSYDPSRDSLTETDFDDAIHLTKDGAEKIFKLSR